MKLSTLSPVLDLFTILLSIGDVVSDVLVAIQYYDLSNTGAKDPIFFTTAVTLLILAQLGYACYFVAVFDYKRRRFSIFLLALLLGQLVPFYIFILYTFPSVLRKLHTDILHLCAGPKNPSKDKNVPDNVQEEDDDEGSLFDPATRRSFLEKKKVIYQGFVVETILEAVPQSILQLTTLVVSDTALDVTKTSDLIILSSLLLSIASIASKGYLFAFAHNMHAYVFNIATFAYDVIGVFTTVTFLFVVNFGPSYDLFFITKPVDLLGFIWFWSVAGLYVVVVLVILTVGLFAKKSDLPLLPRFKLPTTAADNEDEGGTNDAEMQHRRNQLEVPRLLWILLMLLFSPIILLQLVVVRLSLIPLAILDTTSLATKDWAEYADWIQGVAGNDLVEALRVANWSHIMNLLMYMSTFTSYYYTEQDKDLRKKRPAMLHLYRFAWCSAWNSNPTQSGSKLLEAMPVLKELANPNMTVDSLAKACAKVGKVEDAESPNRIRLKLDSSLKKQPLLYPPAFLIGVFAMFSILYPPVVFILAVKTTLLQQLLCGLQVALFLAMLLTAPATYRYAGGFGRIKRATLLMGGSLRSNGDFDGRLDDLQKSTLAAWDSYKAKKWSEWWQAPVKKSGWETTRTNQHLHMLVNPKYRALVERLLDQDHSAELKKHEDCPIVPLPHRAHAAAGAWPTGEAVLRQDSEEFALEPTKERHYLNSGAWWARSLYFTWRLRWEAKNFLNHDQKLIPSEDHVDWDDDALES